MSKHARNIEIYRRCVDDFDISPFESIDMLHRRSNLERVFHQLSYGERMELLNSDILLINNAKKMSEHIAKIYDFSQSDEPLSQWWWHLDQVSNGKINFRLIPTTS